MSNARPHARLDRDGIETPAASAPGLDQKGPELGATLSSRYVVVEEIAQGGMGRVVRAYDPKLQREVALKAVRRDALDEETTRRLVAEARAMAKLSHPNVVAVFDVELASGAEVVLVMEYVAGTTLRQWLAERDRDWKQIVGRFIAAGRGLAGAHQVGLLHRDFKPANVLVGAGGLIVKVTDFGLAKGVRGSVASSSLVSVDSNDPDGDGLTRDGTVMGTPRYMAPEQHDAQQLTAAADQYAFCVALWEALCGGPPFRGGDLAAKKRAGPPPWKHATVPQPVAEALGRGLSADPRERWPNLEALLEALAYDPARRRNRWLGGGVAVAAVAVAGGSLLSWSASRAERCTGAETQLQGAWDETRQNAVESAMQGVGASYATVVWERTDASLDRYAKLWTQMFTETCEATTIRGEQSAEVMDLRMGCLHRARVQLAAATEVLADADADVVSRAYRVVEGLANLDSCADVEALRARVEPPSVREADAVEAARSLLSQADAEREAGRYAFAHAKVTEAEQILVEVEYEPVRIDVALARGRTLVSLARYDEAQQTLIPALERATSRGELGQMHDAATQLLGLAAARQAGMQEALERYRMLAVSMRQDDPKAHASARNNLALVLGAQGKHEEAEAEQRRALAIRLEALGEDHPDVAKSRNNLAAVLSWQGRNDEALEQFRLALAGWEQALGPEHPMVATVHGNIGDVLREQGKYEEAETELRRALAMRQAALGPDHLQVVTSRSELALLLDTVGQHEAAEAELRQVLRVEERVLGADHPDVAQTRTNLGLALRLQDRHEEALAEYRQALAVLEALPEPNLVYLARTVSNLAAVLELEERYEEAEQNFRRAVALWEQAVGAEHPDAAKAHANLAVLLQRRGRSDEAEAELRRALGLLEKGLGPTHPTVAWAQQNLAELLFERGVSQEARTLAELALQTYRQAGDAHREDAAELQVWLQSVSPGARAPH